MSKKKEGRDFFILRESDPHDQDKLTEIYKHHPVIEVDIGQEYFSGDKDVKCDKIVVDNMTYWKAKHYQTGVYWTTNHKDPKIINKVNGKGRGNLTWADKGGNPSGKPKGAVNRVSVAKLCENMGMSHPMELLAALAVSDKATLRRYGVYDKEIKNITVAQKIKCIELLSKKAVPDIKPVDLNSEGEPNIGLPQQDSNDNSSMIQLYLPEKGAHVEIAASEAEIEQISRLGKEKYMEAHKSEVLPYDSDNESESFVWKDVDNE